MTRAPATRPRRAFVFGGGGVLGFAWMLGALAAVEEHTGCDSRDADLVLGTSAGAVLAGLLGCDLPLDALCRHHQGVALPEDPQLRYDYTGTGTALPPRPGWRPAAPGLAWLGLRHPRQVSPLVALSGLLPTGRGTLAPIHDLLATVARQAGFDRDWPQRPRPWVVAVDQSTGRRVVFGRDTVARGPGGLVRIVSRVPLADAVTASCSIPGWYRPTLIDGVAHIDGGIASNASLDLLRDVALDEVFALIPMGGRGAPDPRTPLARVDRWVRRAVSRTVAEDVAVLRARGVRVHVLVPQPRDIEVIGVNLMDPAPRAAVLQTARQTVAEQLDGADPATRRSTAGGQA
ncbi:MAG: patatin-like phospholipase family protein [Jatrophihabitans sp.]|nr:MAG: patatin-like phospholipase family protein [Jatrophihabitans sp.]